MVLIVGVFIIFRLAEEKMAIYAGPKLPKIDDGGKSHPEYYTPNYNPNYTPNYHPNFNPNYYADYYKRKLEP